MTNYILDTFFRIHGHVHGGEWCNCDKLLNEKSEFHFWWLVGGLFWWHFYQKPKCLSPILQFFRARRIANLERRGGRREG